VSKIDEAVDILRSLGLPARQQNERSALTLLALANLSPYDSWRKAKRPLLRTVDIMSFMRNVYDKDYKPNTRETIRRQTLHQFEQGQSFSVRIVRQITNDAKQRISRPFGEPQSQRLSLA